MTSHGTEPAAASSARPGRFALRAAIAGGVVTVLAGADPAVGAASAAVAPEPRVLGGAPSTTAEAPWAVALTDDRGQQFCGGTLVRPGKVVTAAHCTIDESSGADRPAAEIEVIAGRDDLRGTRGNRAEVAEVWQHPSFRDVEQGDDVAVLTLRDPLPQEQLELVDAADTGSYEPGTPGRIYGWGRTAESGSASDTLRSAEVPVAGDAECHDAYPGYDPERMFCAGLPEGGVDSCAGDSGGPYVVNGRLAGVVSYGTGCGRPDTPGVYTRLANYVPEIEAQL